MVRATVLGLLLALPVLASPVSGKPGLAAQEKTGEPDTLVVTIDEARRLALGENPAFLGALQRVSAARGDLRGARTYPLNPEIELEGPGLVTQGSVDSYEVRVGQEIEWAGQRGLRVSAAESALRAQRNRLLDAGRRLLADVERGFVALQAAERRLALAQEIHRLNGGLLEAVQAQLGEGEVSLLEANLARIEAARSRARVLSARGEVSSAGLELGRLLGLAPLVSIRTSGSVFTELEAEPAAGGGSDLLASAMKARPDLAASLWDVERTGSLRSLASRELVPNLTLGAIADRATAGEKAGYGLFLGMSIPLFQRNQGLRMRREAEFRETSMGVLDVELQVRQEVTDARQRLEKATQELDVFEAEVLVPVQQNQALLETAYEEGKLNLPSLLLLRNQLLDAETAYWDAWERRGRALVELRKATAANLDGVSQAIEERVR